MQIHELNNFTGTLGSGAYLAIDDGNDTGKISSQGLLAATEARIDNIIAGPAPSAEEIVDARLGADGVTYPSLGDAIRDQFSDVKSAISNETDAFADATLASEEVTESSTATGWKLNDIGGGSNSDAGYKILKFTVSAGTVLKIKSDHKFQFQNNSSVPAVAVNPYRVGITYTTGTFVLKVPSGATYLIVSTPTTSAAAVYKTESIAKSVGASVSQMQTAFIACESGTFADSDGAIKTANVARIRNVSPIPTDEYKSIIIPDGYEAYIYRLDKSGQFISVLGSWKSGLVLIDNVITSATKYINIGIRNASTPSADISSQVSTVATGLIVHSRTASADALYSAVGRTMNVTVPQTSYTYGRLDFDDDLYAGETVELTLTAAHNTTSTTYYYALYDDAGNRIGDSNLRGMDITHKIKVESASSGFSIRMAELTSGESATFDFAVSLSGHINDRIEVAYDLLPMVPSYYTSHLTSKQTLIRANMANAGVNGDTFVFLTDTHFDSNAYHSPALIYDTITKCGINWIVCNGDIINNEDSKALVYQKFGKVLNVFENCRILDKTYMVIGNHEYNNPGSDTSPEALARQLSIAEIYPFLLQRYEHNQNLVLASIREQGVYALDNEIQKIRYVFLPCSATSGITTAQNAAAFDIIETTPNGWSVMVICHDSVSYNGDTTPPTIAPYGEVVYVVEFLEAVKAQSTYEFNNKTYDFTQKNISPICILGGHAHVDAYYVSEAGILIISTTTDAYAQTHPNTSMTLQTVTEQAFDVVTVDTSNTTIKTTRIGAGSDRGWNYSTGEVLS